ncbi:epimerase [Paenibacillus qinlingensis]|uniref:epimerase n=1 Tax=Paenibacillus qinlingensis TaxID=1837343 RepID=UPI0015639730|nr:epimerase [Paenibacillus qinlingensis]NQX63732.1 epimerase [Paenibacillus qinlingensis]
MSEKHLDTFGEILIKKVRDLTIHNWDCIIDGEMKGQRSKEIREKLSFFNDEQVGVFKELFPMVVDSTIHHLLWTLEEEDGLELFVEVDQKVNRIRDISDGLAGELYTEDGWIMRFSKKRYKEL